MLITNPSLNAKSVFNIEQEANRTTPHHTEQVMKKALQPCPDKPNCVSSKAPQGRSHVEPLHFSGSAEQAWQVLQKVLVDMGGQIVEADDHCVHAVFRSRIFRFNFPIVSG